MPYGTTSSSVLKLGYNHTVAQLDNLALNMDDLDFSLKDIRYTEDTYSLGLFHRSYVGLDAGRRFGLFNETTLSFNTGIRGSLVAQKMPKRQQQIRKTLSKVQKPRSMSFTWA